MSAESLNTGRSRPSDHAGAEPEPNRNADVSLRRRSFGAGPSWPGRDLIGMALSVTGVLLVTRVIGPSQYGIYAMAVGIVSFLSNSGTCGVDVYLLRRSKRLANRNSIRLSRFFSLSRWYFSSGSPVCAIWLLIS